MARITFAGPPLFLVLVAAAGLACDAATGGSGGTAGAGGDGAAAGAGGAGATGGAGGAGGGGTGGLLFGGMGGSMGPFPDFPAAPEVAGTAPATSGDLFGPAGSGTPSGGPCIVEPSPGALFPKNWLRPRFRWIAAGGQNLFELRVKAPQQVNELVVYTNETSWTMPEAMWEGLAQHSVGGPIEIEIRGAVFDGQGLVGEPAIGSTNTVEIAPVDAPGSIVYWTTSGGSSLKGFQVGDESVITVLAPPDVDMNTSGDADVTCIGCHTSTPDGKFASFTAQGPWGNVLGSVEGATKGDAPAFLGPGALQALQSLAPGGIHTYSLAHWAPGDRVAVLPYGDHQAAQLVWVDLEAASPNQGQAWGVLTRQGDPNGVGAPTWSHDGERIVYVSTNAQFTGRLDAGFADLYEVPYADKQGGAASPIPGASDPAFVEYYPAFSPDDALLAFSRAPNGANMYDQAAAEVFVIPSDGGASVRLSANDPPLCAGEASPGVTNSWPKWSPEAQVVGGDTFYWLIFSSRRELGLPQLYVTGVVMKADGAIETHGALYLWNQPEAESNHTPAWDVFEIPPVPPA